MKSRAPRWLQRLEDFFTDDPNEPEFDPADLASALIITLVVIGALYWLLWTLLVYEGGLFNKLGPALRVLVGSSSLKDYGYLGSYEQGRFEGWLGNLCALALTVGAMAVLHRAYWDAAGRRRTK